MQRLKNNHQTELDQLKELLLADELAQLQELASKLESLDFEAQDEETIKQRVTPLFDSMLLERLQNKDAQTVKILSSYLAQIISESSSYDSNALSRSLQSVISPAISKEIENNKEKMIDALYPIMGGMISKYVTQAIKEMMENINKKIEQGLSFERYKRKVKSKLTGVSESELLLEESADARISSLFVIHKETSLLIAEAHLEDKEIDDAHMVASMASAIKDFVNDWMKSHETKQEVQILSYGNATLYIESAGSVYMIAFLDAEPDYEQRAEINAFFAKIVKEYATFFQHFDGDDSADEVLQLSMELEDYLYAQEFVSQEKKSNPAKMMLIILALLLLGYVVYLLNGWYMKYRLEKQVFSQTGQSVMLQSDDEKLYLKGQVASMDDAYEVEKLVKRYSKKELVNQLTVPLSHLDAQLKTQRTLLEQQSRMIDDKLAQMRQEYSSALQQLQEQLSSQKVSFAKMHENLSTKLETANHQVAKLKQEKEALKRVLHMQDEIYEKLDALLGGNPFYNRKNHSLDFRNLSLFEVGDTHYNYEAIKRVAEVFEKYLSVLVGYKRYLKYITIEGHSDSTGLEEENIRLSKERALSVKYYLERLEIVKQHRLKRYLRIKSYGSSRAVVIDGVEDKNASRRIEISFALSDRKIVKTLGESIDD